MQISVSIKKSQQGVALTVCLMILLILSLLGVTAMRMMSSQTLMAASSQAADISYAAGVSVINQAITQGELDLEAREVLPRVGEAPRVVCLEAGQAKPVDCSATTPSSADVKGVSTARVTVATINTDADTSAQAQSRLKMVAKTQGTVPGAVSEFFTFTSQGSVDAMDISVTQTQETYFPHL